MKALVDGDILVYRCAFAAEGTRYSLIDDESGIPIEQFESAAEMKAYVKEHDLQGFSIEKERLVEPLSHALANIKSVMATIESAVKSTDTHVFLSQGKCFRNGLATILEYKANRKDAPKPVYYEEVREYLVKQYGASIFTSIEADDALALCQSDDTVIVSIDKDLLQVPGRHYNWVKDEKIFITPEVGLRKQYQQVLTGDPTDNIPGIRGVGLITARKLLDGVPSTKQALSAVCTLEWEKYLQSDLEKPCMFYSIEDGTRWEYTGWDGTVHQAKTEEIAMEVFQLVTVGGIHAKDALLGSGESLPIPAAEERQEATTA